MGELIDLAQYRTARDLEELEALKAEVRYLMEWVYPVEAELFYDTPFVDILASCKVPVDEVE